MIALPGTSAPCIHATRAWR